jgi:Zn-dependent peptidase ImmA (M78 family)
MYQPHFPPTLTALRRLLPRRALTYAEALVIAERQANRLAAAWGNRSIQERDLCSLTRLDIVRTDLSHKAGFGESIHSGASSYRAGRWVIWLDEAESEARQRFTACHELKHIVDSPHQSSYRNLSEQQIERVCDHFAGCLLMSKRTVYRLWGEGLLTPEALASACRVSL